ncbi:MAG: hypothetical protein ACR2QF_03200 [Geminicoccaceae bacterium]
MDRPAEIIGPEHPISRVADALSDQAFELAAKMEISRWDLCVAMANACGKILADAASKPAPPDGIVMPKRGRNMPRPEAVERMDALREIMEASYDMRDIKGEA